MKYQHRVLGMLSLLAVITYLDRVCIAVAGPRMQDALHISPEAWGWVTSVFFLSYSAFEVPTGALGDRVGPRRVLTRIVAWWSAFTALTGRSATPRHAVGDGIAHPGVLAHSGHWRLLCVRIGILPVLAANIFGEGSRILRSRARAVFC